MQNYLQINLNNFYYSDAIRLCLIYRFGGWYSDLDVIFLRQLTTKHDDKVALKNVIGFDKVSGTRNKINNGIFHNEAGHIFLETAIKIFNSTFVSGQYTSSGPSVVTKAMEKLCGTRIEFITSTNSTNKSECGGMKVVNSKLFFPFDFFHHAILIEQKPESFWEEEFKDSIFVHYYQSSSRGFKHGSGFPSVLRPNHYGKLKPALAYIAPKECPISFYSTSPF